MNRRKCWNLGSMLLAKPKFSTVEVAYLGQTFSFGRNFQKKWYFSWIYIVRDYKLLFYKPLPSSRVITALPILITTLFESFNWVRSKKAGLLVFSSCLSIKTRPSTLPLELGLNACLDTRRFWIIEVVSVEALRANNQFYKDKIELLKNRYFLKSNTRYFVIHNVFIRSNAKSLIY